MRAFHSNAASRGVGCTLATSQPISSSLLRRWYSIQKIEGDKAHETIFDILGIKGGDLTSLQRSPKVLRAYFKRQAMRLDPSNGDDKARLDKLVEAYKLIKDSRSNLQYLDHDNPSIDMRLGVLNEGARVHGTNDPHHMDNLEQLLARNASAAIGDVSGQVPGLTGASLSSSYADTSFGDFASAAGAVGAAFDENGVSGRAGKVGLGDSSHNPLPRPGEVLVPKDGTHVSFLLKLSFDEAVHGCVKAVRYKKYKKCAGCWGSGRNGVRHSRCPQCMGRGSTRFPSGTYIAEQMCGYCSGHGKVPPGLCAVCKGNCLCQVEEVHTVMVPAGSRSSTVLRVNGKGHDGKRGGRAGQLLVTLLVSEHRLFHAVGCDLHCIIPVPLSTALLGGFVKVKTLRGSEQLQLPPGVQSGDVFTMEGLGIQDTISPDADRMREALDDETAKITGSLKVHVVVVVPDGSKLTGRQHRALDAFAEDAPILGSPIDQESEESVSEATPEVLVATADKLPAKKRPSWRHISDPISSPSLRNASVESYPTEVYEQLKLQYSSWLTDTTKPKLSKGGY